MFSTIQNLLSSTTRSNFETQVTLWNALNIKTVEGISKLLDLNLTMMKNSLENSSARTHELLLSQNSLDILSVATPQAPPVSKLFSYTKEVANIASGIRDEFLNATQLELAETKKEMTTILEDLAEREANSFKKIISATKSTAGKVKNGRSKTVTAAEREVPPKKKIVHQRASSKPDTAAKKARQQASAHHVSQNKKTASSASKKNNGHRKAGSP